MHSAAETAAQHSTLQCGTALTCRVSRSGTRSTNRPPSPTMHVSTAANGMGGHGRRNA